MRPICPCCNKNDYTHFVEKTVMEPECESDSEVYYCGRCDDHFIVN